MLWAQRVPACTGNPERTKWDNQERVIKESQERLFRIINRVLFFLRSRAAT